MNEDLADIPAAVTRHMKIVPVKWIDEVLDLAGIARTINERCP